MRKNIKLVSLLMNVIAIVITSAILIGATFAWFTDSATSSGNKIKAGSLKVDLEILDEEKGWLSLKDETNPVFDYENWEPGYTVVKTFKVKNEGTLALKWKAKFFSENKLSALANVIDVYVLPSSVEPTAPTDRNLDEYFYAGTVADFVNKLEETTNGVLMAKEVAYLSIGLKMRNEVGNEYQGIDLGGAFDIVIVATQLSSESDGFGSDYDSSATYPTVASNAQSLKDAMLIRNALIKLESDILVTADTPTQYGLYMFIANGREVTIDLNGHDIVFDQSAPTNVLYVFTTANGGTLNVVGEGNIIVENGVTGVFRGMNPNDQINIYGGEFITDSDDNYLMYVNRGRIDVYGGKFYFPENYKCANAEDSQGDRLGIVFHEGVLLQHQTYQSGDRTRIQLAENCTLVPVEIDGETWYRVSLEV